MLVALTILAVSLTILFGIFGHALARNQESLSRMAARTLAASLLALYPNDQGKIDAVLRPRRRSERGRRPRHPPGAASVAVAGHAFAITATAFAGNRTFHRTAIVQLTGNDRAPYYVLAWE